MNTVPSGVSFGNRVVPAGHSRGNASWCFDLILCRHLAFTYFDQALQVKTLGEILPRLRPGGVLVIGKQEPPSTSVSRLVECKPRTGIFRKLDY